jgi:hypothetical protein
MSRLFFVLSMMVGFVCFGQGAKELPLTYKMMPGEGSGCHCPEGASPVSSSIGWDIATCRSHCEKGLGFRCGSEIDIQCSDGKPVVCRLRSTCPWADINMNSSRKMNAAFNFYDNNTMKLIFQKPVPLEEMGNTDFEVEEEDFFALPDELLIGGVHYTGFQIKVDVYKIDYSDGAYGSVIVHIELKK